jgi:hypothetical protein
VCTTALGGTWAIRSAADAAAACLRCPPTFDRLVPGAACDTRGAVCSYDEATCGCFGNADAGTDAGPQGVWTCTRPSLGCPAHRPRLGAICVHPMECDYGSCLFGAELTFSCRQVATDVFAWQSITAKPCP